MKTPREAGSGEGEHLKVREQLRGLRRIRTPWYFEPSLYRRLQEERLKRFHLPLPLPRMSYAAAIVAVLAVGAGAYFYFAGHSGVEESQDGMKESALVEPPATRPQAIVHAEAPSPSSPPAVRSSSLPERGTVHERVAPPEHKKPQPSASAGDSLRVQTRKDTVRAVRQTPAVPETRVSTPAAARVPVPAKDTTRKVRRDSVRADSLTR